MLIEVIEDFSCLPCTDDLNFLLEVMMASFQTRS